MRYTEEETQQAEDAGYEYALDVIFDSSGRCQQDIEDECGNCCSDLVGYDLADWAFEGVQKAMKEKFFGPHKKPYSYY